MMVFSIFWMVEHFYNASYAWFRGSTYGDICHEYTERVARKYKDAIVVFNSYENMITKDMTHQR